MHLSVAVDGAGHAVAGGGALGEHVGVGRVKLPVAPDIAHANGGVFTDTTATGA